MYTCIYMCICTTCTCTCMYVYCYLTFCIIGLVIPPTLFITAPLDNPQNFVSETINSTSIHLSWDRPSTPNGVITYYSLVYNVVGGSSTDPLLITDTMFTVEGLNEYTEYVFSIAAATSAGLGPETVTTERTDEDGMYIYEPYIHTCMYIVHVHVHCEHVYLNARLPGCI